MSETPDREAIDRAVMSDRNRPCLYDVAGPCQHPKCLNAHYITLEQKIMKPDLEYIMQRDKLIPEAVKFAEDNTPKDVINYEQRRAIWNRLFFSEMDRLARERGLM